MAFTKNCNKILFIFNPVAGKLNSKANMLKIIDIFKNNEYRVSLQITARKGHATEIVLEHGASHDIIACCGGDGTLNEVISGILQLGIPTPVGYLPAGTTNDFANSLGLSSNIDKAADTIMNGQVKVLDIGQFNQIRYFNYIASFGAFTSSSYLTPQSYKNTIGHLAYVFEGIKDIPNIRPYHAKVEVNGEVYEDEYVFGAVSNSTSIGGILKLSTEIVDLNDGLFEILLVKIPKTAMDLHKIYLFLSKKELSNEMVTFIKTSEAAFYLDKQIPWSLDGEFQEGDFEIRVRNIPDAINLLFPHK